MAREYRRCPIILFTVIFFIIFFTGCESLPEKTVVTVPVSVIPQPPPELLTPINRPSALQFISPQDPRASSALTPEGEAALRKMMGQMLDRIDAWRAWSSSPITD